MFTIDHLVLPTVSLEVARRRLQRLGFTVASDARHPFGTGNACVFMRDGTYLEPLSVVNGDVYRSSIVAGNVFVAQDRQARTLSGEEGFSAIAIASGDAESDHARFVDAGASGGDMLEFSRPARLPDGSEKRARFRLAFASRGEGDSFGVFTCQRVDPLPADRTSLERHENGAAAIVEIVLVAPDCPRVCTHLGKVFDTKVQLSGSVGHAFVASNAVVTVRQADDLAQMAAGGDGRPAFPSTGLAGAAIVFRVPDLAVTRAVLTANDVPFMEKGSRIVVAPAPGQGVVFAFEE